MRPLIYHLALCACFADSSFSTLACFSFLYLEPVVAPPSSVVKCWWEVLVWAFGALFLSCLCVGGIVLCRCVCVCTTC